jgi:hypothetical protein
LIIFLLSKRAQLGVSTLGLLGGEMIKIRSAFLFICLVLIPAINCYGQDHPKNEFYSGYTYVRSDFSTNSHGLQLSLTRYLTKSFGITAEASRIFNRQDFGNQFFKFRSTVDISTYMVGPKYAFRNRTRITPYAQALFGVYHIKENSSSTSPAFLFNSLSSFNSLSAAIGGGVDISLNKHISVRAAQVDYFYLRQLSSSHNTRFSTGFVFNFGR